MLRRRLGDEKFHRLLRDVAAHYHCISTEKFRDLASHYATASHDPDLKVFFDNWVYGTGIPSMKLAYSWSQNETDWYPGATRCGSGVQRVVPVEVQTGAAAHVYWLATSSDPEPFSLPLKSRPTTVSLLSNDCLMTILK